MLLALAFLLSCRTDQFPEKETYHITSAFQLTNKRISLNDSKHKVKLLRELDNAEATFKTFSKVNAQGKVINYANGISIDTDEVLYIENGPDYHTYTFNLIRENALPTDPVENLVLTPLSDGTYKEFVVTYNLTVQEKENIRQGYYFYSGKSTTVTELAAGTYNVGGQLAKQVCGYETRTGWNKCSSGAHDGSNYLDCEFMFDFTDSAGNPGTPPTTYTYTVKVCEEQQETFIPSEGGGGGGNTTIGGSPEPELTPNECTVSATNPDEVGIIDANGCNTGFPTLPYTPTSFRFIVRTLPTEVKALLNSNTAFYDGLDAYYTANPTLQGENFVRWAAQSVTWDQFQNWFINGYSDTYRTKLSLLSPTEIQEFVSINTEIDASLYDEEFVKETNEAFVAFTAYGDLETMTNAQMTYVLNNNCCAGLLIQNYIQEKVKTVATNYVLLRKLYPSWSKGKVFWHAARETIHLFLDIAGTVPVIGEVCDITNGFIYTIEGDGLNATLSYAGAIPVAGWGATGAKLAIKTVAGGVSLAMIKNVDGFYVVSRNQQLFRKVLGMVKGDGRIAHHIIPFALQTNPVIQKAMLSKNAFMINNALNGIPVSSAVHVGSHSNYDNIIKTYLNNWNSANPNATPDQAYNYAMFIIQKAKTAIQNNPNIKINDLSF